MGKPSVDLQQLLPVAILGVAGFLLYEGLTGGPAPLHKTDPRNPRVQQTVNKHLEQTAERLEIQKRRMQVENSRLAMDYAQSEPGRAFAAPTEGDELAQDRRAEMVAQDLGLDARQQRVTNPMDLIHHQLFEETRSREMSAAYKKEYARQFVENARRGGYDVQLSDDYKVLSVKPLRRPSQVPPTLFESN